MSEDTPEDPGQDLGLQPATQHQSLPPASVPMSGWAAFLAWVKEKIRDPDRLRGRLDYQSYLLAAAGLFASLILGFGDLSTKGSIRDRQKEDLLSTLAQVIPDRIHDNDLLQDVVEITDEAPGGLGKTEVYLARQSGLVSAVAFRMVALGGYSGPVVLVVGLDARGEVLGVRVISHAETPGLGDKIEAAKSDWIEGFMGRSIANTPAERWRVKKDGGDFDQFAGATITPRAVVAGIARGLDFFARNRLLLVGEKTP